MAGLSYVEVAVRVMQPFVGDALDEAELREICEQAYGRFSHAAVTPLVQLDGRQWLLELFHGPTLAFKDVALQLLGLLFEKFLARQDKHLIGGDRCPCRARQGRYLHAPSRWPDIRCPAAADDHGARAQRPQYRDRRQFR